MAFTYAEGVTGFTNSGLVVSATLTGPIAAGDLICIAVNWNDGGAANTITSVVDSSGNHYTASPHSPITSSGFFGSILSLYYLVAPAGAGKTITVTISPSATDFAINVDRFSVSGGTATFDKDAAGTAVTGATLNTPTITPTNTGSLVYYSADVENGVSAPLAGATLGIWTGGGAGVNNEGAATEYVLSSASGTITPQQTQSPSGLYLGGAMAFFISGTPPPTTSGNSLMMMGVGT